MAEQERWFALPTENLNLESPCDYESLLSQLVGYFEMDPLMAKAKLEPYADYVRRQRGCFILREGKLDPFAMELFGVTARGETRLAVITASPLDNSFAIRSGMEDLSSVENNAVNMVTQNLLEGCVVYGTQETFDYQGLKVIVRHNIADGTFSVHFCSADMTEKYYSFAFNQNGELVDTIDFKESYVQFDKDSAAFNKYKVLVLQALQKHVLTDKKTFKDVVAEVRYAIERSGFFQGLRDAYAVLETTRSGSSLAEKAAAGLDTYIKMRNAARRRSPQFDEIEDPRREAVWLSNLEARRKRLASVEE